MQGARGWGHARSAGGRARSAGRATACLVPAALRPPWAAAEVMLGAGRRREAGCAAWERARHDTRGTLVSDALVSSTTKAQHCPPISPVACAPAPTLCAGAELTERLHAAAMLQANWSGWAASISQASAGGAAAAKPKRRRAPKPGPGESLVDRFAAGRTPEVTGLRVSGPTLPNVGLHATTHRTCAALHAALCRPQGVAAWRQLRPTVHPCHPSLPPRRRSSKKLWKRWWRSSPPRIRLWCKRWRQSRR